MAHKIVATATPAPRATDDQRRVIIEADGALEAASMAFARVDASIRAAQALLPELDSARMALDLVRYYAQEQSNYADIVREEVRKVFKLGAMS